METVEQSQFRSGLRVLVEHRWFQRVIVTLIILNGITLGLDAVPGHHGAQEPWLVLVDRIVVGVFLVEIALRIAAYGRAYFRDPWNLFDVLVVGVSVLPNSGVLSILRVLRVLRLLRLISLSPSLRVVVEGLLSALPRMGAVSSLLVLFLYIGSVIVTRLFGEASPEHFGRLDVSIFSLMQVTTLDGWSEMARAAMQTHPYAWIFFFGYMLLTTFTVLNLFVGVMVTSMEERLAAEKAAREAEAPQPEAAPVPVPAAEPPPFTAADIQALVAAVESLRADMNRLAAANAVPPAP